MYQTLQVPFRKARFRIPPAQSAQTSMVNPTIDLRDLPQLMNPQEALQVINYLPTSDAQLPKRSGLSKIFEVAGDFPITLLAQFTPTVWIFGYDTTTAAYNTVTQVVTTIKNNWPSDDPQSGVRYGEYFFVCNGSDVIHRIDLALTITAVVGSPHAKVLKAIGARLYAGNLSTDSTAVAYSYTDDGTNPPFTNFTVGTAANQGGLINYRNAGDVTAIDSLGANIIIGAKEGKWSFTITVQDVAGVLTKNDQTVLQRLDMGMARATIVTPKAMFYPNSGGLWQFSSVGQSNVPFSEQEGKSSLILGAEYFQNLDLTNADFAYDQKIDTLFLTCARNSNTNNLVIAYNLTSNTYAEFTGWNINRFMNIDGVIYGASSAEIKVWQCFSGNDDDGSDIWTTFYQELKLGDLETRQELLRGYLDAFLSPSSSLRVCFDIYDIQGNFVQDKLCFTFPSTSGAANASGYGVVSWGSSGFGGSNPAANGNVNPADEGMTEIFDGFGAGYIRNFQRIRIKITEHSKVPHALVWIKIQSEPKVQIRRRKMVKTT